MEISKISNNVKILHVEEDISIKNINSLEHIEKDIELVKELKNRELNDIKYPTFDDITLEEQLKSDVTFEALLIDLKSCDEALNYFSNRYDHLFLEHPNGIIVKSHLKLHNMNYIAYKMFTIVLTRQITLLHYFVQKKFTNDKVESELINKQIKESFKYNLDDLNSNSDIDHIIEQLIKDNFNYFINEEEVESDKKQQVIDILKFLFKNEKMLINFEFINEDFIPSKCSLNLSLKILKNVIDQISNQLNEIITYKQVQLIPEENMIKFFHNCTKLEILSNFFILCYKIPQDDIFNLSENSETWINLKKHIERKVVFSRLVMNKKLQNVFNMIVLGNASMSKGHNQFTSKYSKIIGTGWYFAYFFFNKKQAEIQSIKFSINPDYDVANKIWNMMDAKGIKNLLKLTLPSVKYSTKWYLKRTEPAITHGLIKQLIEEIKSDSLNTKLKNEQIKMNRPDSIIMDNYYKRQNLSNFDLNDSLTSVTNSKENNLNLYLKSVNLSNISDYVKIKIINHKEFYIPAKKSVWNMMKSCFNVEKNIGDAVIIHIHGGGFIAMSPSSHENYTRKWTNKLEVPVFSIDYRLAPDNPYPKALDDVYQAYMWIIKYAEEVFKMNIEKVILVGDSAGGNLVVSLTYLLILLQKKLPTAIFLAYPAMSISTTNISCSFLNVLNDQILPYHLIKYCLESYRGDYNNEEDPFFSPLIMDCSIMAHLPPVRIICGSSDPLRDDSVLFLNKLVNLNIDAKFIELKYFPHGFLNYDFPLMMPEASVGSDILIEEMKKILDK